MNQKLKKQIIKSFAVLFSAAALLTITNSLTSHAVPPRKRPRIEALDKRDSKKYKRDLKQSFWDAVEKGNITIIKELITKNEGQKFGKERRDLIDTLNGNETALTWAVKKNNLRLCEVLLSLGATVDQPNKSGNTALMDASRLGYDNILTILLKCGANPNQYSSSYYHDTPLMKALKNGHPSTVNLLLQNSETNINQICHFGETALLFAINEVGKKRLDILDPLIDNEKIDLTIGNNTNGNTALHYAVEKKAIPLIEKLLSKGIDPNITNKNGMTPLMTAVIDRNMKEDNIKQILEILLEHSAKVNAKSKNGDTALILAVKAGRTAILKTLLEHGADVNAKNKNGDTALILAVKAGRKDMVNALLNVKGIDLKSRDAEYKTALLHAILNHDYHIAWALKNADADDDLKELRANAAALLFEGARTDNKAFIGLAARHFPQLSEFKNNKGQNALMVAAMHGHTNVGILLISYFGHIDINEQDNFGDTVFIHAVKHDHPKFVKFLLSENHDTFTSAIDFEVLKITNKAGCDVNSYARTRGFRNFFDWLRNSSGGGGSISF